MNAFQTTTALKLAQELALRINNKPPQSLATGVTLSAQYLAAINDALLVLYSQAGFWWDDFFGSFITVPGKNTYPITPVSTNYYPKARDLNLATRSNCTVLPKYATSFDDTYRMARFQATNTTAYFERTALHTSDGTRATFSIWLMSDTPAPTTVTLALIQGGDTVATKTIVVQSTPNRYNISAYLPPSTSQTRCRVTFTGTGSVLFADAAQYELTDYATEFIDNTSDTAPAQRTVIASPDRLRALTPYKYNTVLTYKDVVWKNAGLQPFEHRRTQSVFVEGTVVAGSIVLHNAAPDTHFVYWGKKLPPELKADTDTIEMPRDAVSVLLAGARAYMLKADYDIGSNTQVAKDEQYFFDRIQDLIDKYAPPPGTATMALCRAVW